MKVSPWEKFAADLFQDFIRDDQQLDFTEGVRFCREMWLRKKAFDRATAFTSPDPIN